MKTPVPGSTPAVRCVMGTDNFVLKLVVSLLTLLFLQSPGFSDQTISRMQDPQATIKPVKPSADDVLIVQLAPGVNQDQLDELLKSVHGTFLRTIEVSPALKFQVILTESGEAMQVEKRLTDNKQIAQVQRNTIYRIKNDVAYAEHAGSTMHFRPVKSIEHAQHAGGIMRFRPIKIGHSPIVKIGHGISSGHSNNSSAPPPAPTQPPVVNGGTLSGVPNDPYFSAEWDLNMMNFTQARDSGAPYATLVPMYFLDSGYSVSADSPGFVVQYNFSDPINPSGARESVFDAGTHGTETATVTAFSDNNTGFTGAANLSGQRIMLYELRISADGQSAGLLNILSALAFLANQSGFLCGPVNLSYNSPPPNTLNANPSIQQVAFQLSQRGFLVVNAAGNDGLADSSPEMYMRRIAALTMTGSRASYSNYGAFNTAAPGDAVPCYTPQGGTSETFDSGTSFAAPRWCAAVADVMGVQQPQSRNACLADLIIRQTGSYNGQGFIIPNMQAAIQRAAGQ